VKTASNRFYHRPRVTQAPNCRGLTGAGFSFGTADILMPAGPIRIGQTAANGAEP
jgi:hypothetical protein